PHEFWGERAGSLGGVRAAFWTPARALGRGRLRLLGWRLWLAGRFLLIAAHDLFDAHRKRTSFLDTDQGHGEEGETWHRLAIQARKETIEAMGMLAGFSDDDFIASG